MPIALNESILTDSFTVKKKYLYKAIIILLCSNSAILISYKVVFYVIFISGAAHDISTPVVDTNDTVEQFQSSRFVNQEQQFSSSRWLSKDSLPMVVCELN